MKIIKIGRALDNDWTVDDATASRYHCHIVKKDDDIYEIFDDKSKNGTFVNGWKISGSKTLDLQDNIMVGHTKIKVWELAQLFESPLPGLGGAPENPLPPREQPVDNPVMPDGNDINEHDPSDAPSDDYLSIYRQAEEKLMNDIMALQSVMPYIDTLYTKFFDSPEIKKKYYLGEYVVKIAQLKMILGKIEISSQELESLCEKMIQYDVDGQKKYNELSSLAQSEVKKCYNRIETYYSEYFNQQYDTADADASLWELIEFQNNKYPTTFLVGRKNNIYKIFGKAITVSERNFVEVLNKQHISIHYHDNTKLHALGIVNSLIGRLMASFAPGKFTITMADAVEMDGTSDIFKRINRDICQILARQDEIRRALDATDRHVGNIIQNLLLSPIDSLYEYNLKKENKEAYHLWVIEDYPSGIGGESQYLLERIMNNGVRAGVIVFLLINDSKITHFSDSVKVAENIEKLERHCKVINVDSAEIDRFDILHDKQLYELVKYVNFKEEIREDDTVSFADYMLPESEWWRRTSVKYIEVPFGISDDKQIQRLKITQESGQNSVVVIGIPGSGKSVFLHTLICNAAINYSPDELNLYLIDFSGVEFNSYALHQLPHARVIAPEAEREFGLSVLKELVEEGTRRMELCRTYDVSNIVDLKAKNPSLSVPRLLVIIDEFQKFFEIENDNISKEANAKIHTIIQEFRKFGINLILATQKLPSSSILPKDLIANRIVFRSSPVDFSSLISLANNTKMPQLRTGECIYNSESGSPYDNNRVQGFFIKRQDIDRLLPKMVEYGRAHNFARQNELLVFRGNDLPEFSRRRTAVHHRTCCEKPSEVGIYFGESIAISETDVCVGLRKESGNNILILGGETNIAQRIAFYASVSATTAHTDKSAMFFTFNFIRSEDPFTEDIRTVFSGIPFPSNFAAKQDEVLEYLSIIKEEVEYRRDEETREQTYIYLTIYAFQLARMFDRGGRHGDDVSECGKLLEYVLRYGPSVGVFTILQVDNWENLARIGNLQSHFVYRIALQMSENDSTKVLGTSAANKLFVFNRPSSRYRAFLRDNNRNITIKFKPYK